MSSLRAPLSSAIKELRIHLCQTGAGSAGVRSFLAASYPALKKANPSLPILIREAGGVEARAFARYSMGAEKVVVLQGLDESRISAKLEELNNPKA
ncbi:thioredoxin-like protein [Blastocladiella britannica]|nr:thioredoxin-like protein [Blastocladiella britannica]